MSLLFILSSMSSVFILNSMSLVLILSNMYVVFILSSMSLVLILNVSMSLVLIRRSIHLVFYTVTVTCLLSLFSAACFFNITLISIPHLLAYFSNTISSSHVKPVPVIWKMPYLFPQDFLSLGKKSFLSSMCSGVSVHDCFFLSQQFVRSHCLFSQH